VLPPLLSGLGTGIGSVTHPTLPIHTFKHKKKITRTTITKMEVYQQGKPLAENREAAKIGRQHTAHNEMRGL
jgi:hypothetical protein